MNKFQEVYDLQTKYKLQVVGKYDMVNGLSPNLYRIDGFSYTASGPHGLKIALKPIDSKYEHDGDLIWVHSHTVLSYEQILEIRDNTRKLFAESKDFFTGVFTQSIAPMKRDLHTLNHLLEEYHERGLVIGEDEVCVNTAE